MADEPKSEQKFREYSAATMEALTKSDSPIEGKAYSESLNRPTAKLREYERTQFEESLHGKNILVRFFRRLFTDVHASSDNIVPSPTPGSPFIHILSLSIPLLLFGGLLYLIWLFLTA